MIVSGDIQLMSCMGNTVSVGTMIIYVKNVIS